MASLPVSNTGVTLDGIAALFSDNNKKIESMLAVQFQIWSDQFNQRIVTLENNVKSLTNANNETVARLDEIDRKSQLSDLLVYGVPVVEKENLHTIFQKICAAIEFNFVEGHLLKVFRLPNYKNEGPIVLKFVSSTISNELFIKYLNKKNLNLTHLNFDIDRRVFIREGLTKTNAFIFSEALKLRRNGILASTYTRKGQILIRIAQEDKPILVTSVEKLNEIASSIPQRNINKRRLNESSGSTTSPVANEPKAIKTYQSSDGRRFPELDKFPLSGVTNLGIPTDTI